MELQVTGRTCSVEGCPGRPDKPLRGGLCPRCYQRAYRADPERRAKHVAWNVEYGRREPVKEKRNQYHRDRWASDAEHRARASEYHKQYHQTEAGRATYERSYQIRISDPERMKELSAYARERNTGFSPQMVEDCWAFQGGKCAICAETMKRWARGRGSMHADHCHVTGAQRGLLCATCNVLLGHYENRQRLAGGRKEEYEAYIARPPVERMRSGS